jgi:hypothetical protein
MILSAIAERLKRRSKNDFKGRHFEAPLILQAVSWYLRYLLSQPPSAYRDIGSCFLEPAVPQTGPNSRPPAKPSTEPGRSSTVPMAKKAMNAAGPQKPRPLMTASTAWRPRRSRIKIAAMTAEARRAARAPLRHSCRVATTLPSVSLRL